MLTEDEKISLINALSHVVIFQEIPKHIDFMKNDIVTINQKAKDYFEIIALCIEIVSDSRLDDLSCIFRLKKNSHSHIKMLEKILREHLKPDKDLIKERIDKNF